MGTDEDVKKMELDILLNADEKQWKEWVAKKLLSIEDRCVQRCGAVSGARPHFTAAGFAAFIVAVIESVKGYITMKGSH